MKLHYLFLIVAFSVNNVFGADLNSQQTNADNTVFRQPFTLKLHVNKEHYYEQNIQKTPYVFKNTVFLFKDDSFGIDLDIADGVIRSIAYQPDTDKATVILRFTQDKGEAMMMLAIENKSNQKLFVDALMVVPGRDNAIKTSILPTKAGLTHYETWPHPIIQLILRNIRLTERLDTE